MVEHNNLKNCGLSVVLGTYNRKTFLKLTIESIRRELVNAPFPHEIIVIDGGSTDGTIKWLAQQKDIISIIQHNRGKWRGKEIERKSWGYFMNLGFKCAQGKYICMLSDDCLVVPGAIINGYNLFETKLKNHEKVGAVAFFFRDWPDQVKYHVHLYWDVINMNHGLYLNEALKAVNYADEDTYQFYTADVDLVYKLLNENYISIFSENSFIEHFSHANTQIRLKNRQIENDNDSKFYKKWRPIFKNIELNPSNKWKQIEINFNDNFNTVQHWQKLFIVKIFLIRRFFARNVIDLIYKYLHQE